MDLNKSQAKKSTLILEARHTKSIEASNKIRSTLKPRLFIPKISIEKNQNPICGKGTENSFKNYILTLKNQNQVDEKILEVVKGKYTKREIANNGSSKILEKKNPTKSKQFQAVEEDSKEIRENDKAYKDHNFSNYMGNMLLEMGLTQNSYTRTFERICSESVQACQETTKKNCRHLSEDNITNVKILKTISKEYLSDDLENKDISLENKPDLSNSSHPEKSIPAKRKYKKILKTNVNEENSLQIECQRNSKDADLNLDLKSNLLCSQYFEKSIASKRKYEKISKVNIPETNGSIIKCQKNFKDADINLDFNTDLLNTPHSEKSTATNPKYEKTSKVNVTGINRLIIKCQESFRDPGINLDLNPDLINSPQPATKRKFKKIPMASVTEVNALNIKCRANFKDADVNLDPKSDLLTSPHAQKSKTTKRKYKKTSKVNTTETNGLIIKCQDNFKDTDINLDLKPNLLNSAHSEKSTSTKRKFRKNPKANVTKVNGLQIKCQENSKDTDTNLGLKSDLLNPPHPEKSTVTKQIYKKISKTNVTKADGIQIKCQENLKNADINLNFKSDLLNSPHPEKYTTTNPKYEKTSKVNVTGINRLIIRRQTNSKDADINMDFKSDLLNTPHPEKTTVTKRKCQIISKLNATDANGLQIKCQENSKDTDINLVLKTDSQEISTENRKYLKNGDFINFSVAMVAPKQTHNDKFIEVRRQYNDHEDFRNSIKIKKVVTSPTVQNNTADIYKASHYLAKNKLSSTDSINKSYAVQNDIIFIGDDLLLNSPQPSFDSGYDDGFINFFKNATLVPEFQKVVRDTIVHSNTYSSYDLLINRDLISLENSVNEFFKCLLNAHKDIDHIENQVKQYVKYLYDKHYGSLPSNKRRYQTIEALITKNLNTTIPALEPEIENPQTSTPLRNDNNSDIITTFTQADQMPTTTINFDKSEIIAPTLFNDSRTGSEINVPNSTMKSNNYSSNILDAIYGESLQKPEEPIYVKRKKSNVTIISNIKLPSLDLRNSLVTINVPKEDSNSLLGLDKSKVTEISRLKLPTIDLQDQIDRCQSSILPQIGPYRREYKNSTQINSAMEASCQVIPINQTILDYGLRIF